MFTSFLRRLFGTPATATTRKARLGFDTFEDRLAPAFVGLDPFTPGVLSIQADQTTDDTVTITAAGANPDGSTGVTVVSSLTGGVPVTFTDITTINLDLKDGNDVVNVASLSALVVLVGEGNGNNTISIGNTLAAAVVAGSGQNSITVGNGTMHGAFTSFTLPGAASSAAFVGWGYMFDGGGIYLTGPTFSTSTLGSSVSMNSLAGYTTFVDIYGGGNHSVFGGAGNDYVSILQAGSNTVFVGGGDDLVWITGDGSNSVNTGAGNDTVEINGNGNNDVTTAGTGVIVVNGSGKNSVDAKNATGATISLNGAGKGSTVVADNSCTVFVDGVQAVKGANGNVRVRFTR